MDSGSLVLEREASGLRGHQRKKRFFFICSSVTDMFYDPKQIISLYNVQFLPNRVAVSLNWDNDRMHVM